MWTMMIAAALLVQPADSVTVTGVVVGPAGTPVFDVEVVLAARRPADESVPTLARTTTDARGAFRLELDRQKLQGVGPFRLIWAYRPGGTIAMERAELAGKGALPPVRLTLAEPLKRTMTIRDADGRPLAGVRLVPLNYTINGRALYLTPDDWLERLTVATGPDGMATLPYLPATTDPHTVRVTAPGMVPHDFILPDRPGSDRFTLKLGRPARLAGSVSNDSGQPAANVPVEVWTANRPGGAFNPDADPKPAGLRRLIHFDSGPVRTGADGSFRTPPQLMTGSSYRVVIRPEGASLVSVEALTAKAELTTVPPLRLHQRRKLIGLVHDRQGQPVASARVFLPSVEAATKTDSQGRFLLEGILPDRTYILIQAEGFRLQGWPSVPASQPQERTLTLVRSSEPPDRTLKPLPPPIPMEESRALARRVLEPYVKATLEKGDDNSRWNCLGMLSQVDPIQALELLETQHFQNPSLGDSLRNRIGTELLATDPVEAESVVAAIVSPGNRALAYVWLVDALPDTERDRKRGLLERATVHVQAPTGAGRGAEPGHRLFELARVANGWLDLGEVEKARPLIREGLEMVEALPPPQRYEPDFLKIAARLELDRVLSLIRDLSNARRRHCYVAIAEAVASDHPVESERVFQLIDDSSDVPAYHRKNELALRLCRLMAKTDPEGARRLIAGLKIPREQACGWALLALGLADRDQPAARAALAEAIRLIDGLSGPRDNAERVNRRAMVAENPAASILPIVEMVAPERLEAVFWKAVALMPKDDMDAQSGVVVGLVIDTATFLARYDRQVADVFLTQTTASRLRGPSGDVRYALTGIRAKAVVDPRGAVAMFEALPPVGPDQGRLANRVFDETRSGLITRLVEPVEEPWKAVWRRSGIPVDKAGFR